MAQEASAELERFRLEWQHEVEARSRASKGHRQGPNSQRTSQAVAASQTSLPTRFTTELSGTIPQKENDYRHNGDYGLGSDLGVNAPTGHTEAQQEPRSALEHYERAVEREGEGSLGDSLKHYRTAYKLDAGVDRLYKNKHFPVPSTSADLNSSNVPVTVPNTAHHSLDGPEPLSVIDLVVTYQGESIVGQSSCADAPDPLPCPMAALPSEVLLTTLSKIALFDVATFARLAQVCKRLAYLVVTEDRIWRRVCEGHEVGFGAMHYAWALTVTGMPLPKSIADLDVQLSNVSLEPTIRSLQLSPKYASFRTMFRERPRIRYNGCYISTVNYIRPGVATASQATWTSPVLIVTYYRYLRFFRDGSCVSLLTTTEPADVVHHLTKENMHSHHAGGLPSAVMNQALRGRWKLKGDPFAIGRDTGEEGTLDIETQGADADRPEPKYIYKMMLQLGKASKHAHATKNNRLSWLGFWSYNSLTDDWAEFNLKNDRAFFWSRVKSFGNGE